MRRGVDQSRAGLEQIIFSITAPHTGPIARAKTAIALHVANNAQAPALGSYRPSTGSARAGGVDAQAQPPRSVTALFAIELAPEPVSAEAQAQGRGCGRGAADSSRSARECARTSSARHTAGDSRGGV